jgi:hypothetical protein
VNYLRQSTAVDLGIGPFIDDDGITPATGLSITQAEVRLKKNNGAWAQVNDSTTATHEEEGWYEKEFDATDTNTVGILIVAVYISGSLAWWQRYQVVEEAIYDALFAASATGALPVSTGGIAAAAFAAGAIDAAAIADNAIDAGAIASNAITAAKLAADCITAAKIADGAIDAATFAADVDAEFLSYIVDDATRIDASSLNVLSVDYGNAELTTDITGNLNGGVSNIGGLDLTNIPWNAAWDAEVQSEATDALNAYDPPTRAELTSDINSVIAYLDGLVIKKGTIGATGNDTTHIHIDGATYGNDEINNYLIAIKDVSENEWHARYIEDFTATGDLATVATLPFTPEASTDLYVILAFRQDVTGGSGLDAAGVRAALGFASASYDTDVAGLNTKLDAIDNFVDTEVGALTTELAKVPKSDSNVTWNATAAAQIQSEANDALVANNLDHLVLSAVDANFATTVHANSVIGHLADNGAGFDRTTDSLEAIRDRGDAAWITATSVTTSAFTAGALAQFITTDTGETVDDAVGGSVVAVAAVYNIESSFTYDAVADYSSAHAGSLAKQIGANTATATWAVGARTLTALDEDSTTLDLDATIRAAVGLGSANLDTQLDALPTAAENATAVWATGTREITGGTVSTVSDKTGYSLAATGLDSIAVTDPGAPASHTSIPKMIVAIWRALWKKETLTSTELKRYADNGTTVNATSAVSDNGSEQTKGSFS